MSEEITEEYLNSLDKRTKEYKEAKAKFENSSKGLGDTVEKITKATGIKKVVDSITDDCGCDERKAKLNKVFPYRKLECLTEEEYFYLKKFFKQTRVSISPKQQQELTDIYQRVFGVKIDSSCSTCSFKNEVYKPLERMWKKYN